MVDGAELYSLAQTYPAVVTEMKARMTAAQARYAPFRRGVPPAVQRRIDARNAAARQ